MGVRLTVTPLGVSASGLPTIETVYELDQDRILVGRGGGVDVRLPHPSVSVRHATIEQRGGRYTIVDHQSTNGTHVAGARVVPERPKQLRDGDVIDVGAFRIAWKEGVPVTRSLSAERTSSLARRLLRGVLDDAAPPAPRLVVVGGKSDGDVLVLPAPPARVVIGRGDTADLVVDDPGASREHVEILVDLDGALARDLGSKNGLVIGGRAHADKRLADGDEIVVGASLVVYEDPAESALREAEAADDVAIAPPPAPRAPTPAIEEDKAAPTGVVEARDVPAPAPRAATGRTPELLIYALAALVFLASVVALFALFHSAP